MKASTPVGVECLAELEGVPVALAEGVFMRPLADGVTLGAWPEAEGMFMFMFEPPRAGEFAHEHSCCSAGVSMRAAALADGVAMPM